MSDKSPLFVSANELLAHSIELYTQGNERKYKFVILHLANAIELILKDRVIDLGISIYKKHNNNTIGIWDAFLELEKANIQVPERPVIELLVDDRNTIQHRFGFPNADAVFYYLDHVLKFFCRFLKEEYSVDLIEVMRLYVDDEALAVVGLIEKEDESTPLNKLFSLSPESAVLQAYSLVERKLIDHLAVDPEILRRNPFPWRYPEFRHLLRDLANKGFISQESAKNFDLLREMRNRAAHSAHFHDDVSIDQWQAALDIGKDLIAGIDRAGKEGFLANHSIELQAAITGRVQRFNRTLNLPPTQISGENVFMEESEQDTDPAA